MRLPSGLTAATLPLIVRVGDGCLTSEYQSASVAFRSNRSCQLVSSPEERPKQVGRRGPGDLDQSVLRDSRASRAPLWSRSVRQIVPECAASSVAFVGIDLRHTWYESCAPRGCRDLGFLCARSGARLCPLCGNARDGSGQRRSAPRSRRSAPPPMPSVESPVGTSADAGGWTGKVKGESLRPSIAGVERSGPSSTGSAAGAA